MALSKTEKKKKRRRNRQKKKRKHPKHPQSKIETVRDWNMELISWDDHIRAILRLSYIFIYNVAHGYSYFYSYHVCSQLTHNKPIIKPNLQLSIGTIAVICNIYKN